MSSEYANVPERAVFALIWILTSTTNSPLLPINVISVCRGEQASRVVFVLAVLRPLIKSQFAAVLSLSFSFPIDLITFPFSSLSPLKQNLEGNLDANTVEEHHLEMAIVGVRRLRLVPLSNYTRTVCLRFELYGCPYYGKCKERFSGVYPRFANYRQI